MESSLHDAEVTAGSGPCSPTANVDEEPVASDSTADGFVHGRRLRRSGPADGRGRTRGCRRRGRVRRRVGRTSCDVEFEVEFDVEFDAQPAPCRRRIRCPPPRWRYRAGNAALDCCGDEPRMKPINPSVDHHLKSPSSTRSCQIRYCHAKGRHRLPQQHVTKSSGMCLLPPARRQAAPPARPAPARRSAAPSRPAARGLPARWTSAG